jgi:CheY-like chemotaxis protein
LVVDDELDVLETLCEEFYLKNWEVQGVRESRHALEFLRAQNFDVVVCDLVMPEIDGLSLLREVRKKDLDIIFVLMSGYNVVPLWDCFDSGATEVLGKPFRFQVLSELVHRMQMPMWERWGASGKQLCAGKIVNHISISIEDENQVLCLGRSGIFIAPGNIGRVLRGDVVSFSIKSPHWLLEGAGKIQWTRQSSSGLPAGLGIEFLHLEDSCRKYIIQTIEKCAFKAVIPSGVSKQTY